MGAKRFRKGWLSLAVAGALVSVSVLAAQVRPQSRPAADLRLAEAARKNDAARAQELIQQRVDVNAVETDGSTALLWATYHGNVDLARNLVAAGADVNAANRYGLTPLLEASRLGYTAIIEDLLAAGASPLTPGPEGETPLMAASGSGNLRGVQLFLARGADVNTRETGQEQTALMWAADGGHADVVRALVAAGADVNAVAKPTSLPHIGGEGGRMYVDHSSRGLTALMFAARQGHLDAARALAENGADLAYRNPDGLSAMLLAVINDHVDLAAMLLEHGANPNDGSMYEAIQLHNLRTNSTVGEATRPRPDSPNALDPVDFVSRLLDAGGDPMRPNEHTLHFDGTGGVGAVEGAGGQTAFGLALQQQDVAMVKVMLEHGLDPNVGDNGVPPLLLAVTGGGRGRGGFGFGATPAAFRFSSERSATAAVDALLAAGADINAVAPTGDTVMHRAAQAGDADVIRALAKAGAALDVRNRDGLTPLDVAMGREGASAGRGGRAGGPPGRGGGPRPQPEAIQALRELMGLPAEPGPGAASAPTGGGGR